MSRRRMALWIAGALAIGVALSVAWLVGVEQLEKWFLSESAEDLKSQYEEEERVKEYARRRDEMRDSYSYRDELSLHLPLANGEVKTFIDNPCDCDGAISYDFIGYISCYAKLDWLPVNPVWVDSQTIRLERSEDATYESDHVSIAVRPHQVVMERRDGTWGPPCRAKLPWEEREKRSYFTDEEEP